ncbi:DsbA family protein [Stappia stellulata]|uniref:DsbA family protein n=1 Tax=Stappia stellulata TaxID=71235 RepID=UPI0003F5DE2B|nr:DsbA family protein [Stappia stellulata]
MLTRRTLLIAGAAGTASLLASGFPAAAQSIPTVEEVLFDEAIPTIGNPDGDVTIAEYFDYQCPFCKRGHPDLLDVVASDGNIRLVMKDWPIFGEPSVYAASLVLAAGDDYEAAHTALMKTEGRLSRDDVDATLAGAGHDPERLAARAAEQATRIQGILDRNTNQASAFGFRGTPVYLVNTQLNYGAMDKAALLAAVERARAA